MMRLVAHIDEELAQHFEFDGPVFPPQSLIIDFPIHYHPEVFDLCSGWDSVGRYFQEIYKLQGMFLLDLLPPDLSSGRTDERALGTVNEFLFVQQSRIQGMICDLNSRYEVERLNRRPVRHRFEGKVHGFANHSN